MGGDYVPIARFLSSQEAYPLAGRLRAEGIDARVVPQGDSLYPYRAPAGAGVISQVIVPQRHADRARWVLAQHRPEDPDVGKS